MKCYKYAIEGYDDFLHKIGYFKGYKIFIPSPYNFSIFMFNDKIKSIKRQNKIDDFTKDYYKFDPKICEIDVDEKIIINIYNNLLKEEEMLKVRETFTESILSFQTEEEKTEKLFNKGLELLENEEYIESIDKFKSCLSNDKYKKASYYNISCCFSNLNDKKNGIEYLLKSIESGYAKWHHILSDYNLKNIVDEPEIVEIIKKLMTSNKYENYDDKVDKYIRRHYLHKYYSEK